MKVRIYITLKKSVLDTQGKAIENALNKNLGFNQISQVRQGKLVELELTESDNEKAKKIIDEICDKLLVNKIIEDYSFEVVK
ncbi:MAG: phosphoribosylformylglycinamidine synthase subunit PurS [Rickettsiales bacterium]|jgi:phosphoribosylformylglycinamidine synthase|nr:phosphoribosylformylglycinamidine synthase subunit PurS [Rickettsiales bacterium]